MGIRSFFPILGATKNVTASTSSAATAFDVGTLPSGEFQVRIYNSGTDTVFVSFGDSTLTVSTTADMPVVGGATEVVTVTNPAMARVTHFGTRTASGSPVVYFTPGHGI